jgi:TonB family C-terminal domain
MASDFNLMSQKWLDLIFKDRNKAYGAYEMRESSSDRHLKALIIVTIVGLGLVYLPTLIKSVIPEKKDLAESSVVEMIDMNLDAEIPEENQIREIENIPPPPQLKETVAFTPPKIVHDDEITDKDLMLTQQELTETQADISIATIEGVKDGGIDIADLQEHKVVVQDNAPPQVYSHVEVPPQFPGGEAELMKWLHENIQYPIIAMEQGIQGRVVLRFVVGPDGSVGQIEVVRSLDPSCDREAVRQVGRMPKWIPGKQNGNPVYVYYTLPVLFRLQN